MEIFITALIVEIVNVLVWLLFVRPKRKKAQIPVRYRTHELVDVRRLFRLGDFFSDSGWHYICSCGTKGKSHPDYNSTSGSEARAFAQFKVHKSIHEELAESVKPATVKVDPLSDEWTRRYNELAS